MASPFDDPVPSCNTTSESPRPVRHIDSARAMYCAGLDLSVIGAFENHEGFDGVMLGGPGLPYHFEFTCCRTHPVSPRPTAEDLLVCFVPEADAWEERCAAMLRARFAPAVSFNPYWALRGRTFEDTDGYRVVIQQSYWANVESF